MEDLAKQYAAAMVDYYLALHCEQSAQAGGCAEMHPFRRDTRVAYDTMCDLQNALAMLAEETVRGM
jgi:hypothetical protein